MVVSRIGMAAPAMGECPFLHLYWEIAADPWQRGMRSHCWQGTVSTGRSSPFLPASAIPPVIMNMLEKRAFLKVPVNLGWAGGRRDTHQAWHIVGTPQGWHLVGE